MAKQKLKRTPATSEGARYERAAFRSRLRRVQARMLSEGKEGEASVINDELLWVLKRQKRYDKKKGGL